MLTLLAIVLGWRGSDLPAQVFRADLVRRDGFVIWNSQWFGGHAILGYSVFAPAIGALTGPLALGALSGVASALLFERILRFSFGAVAWLGALWFALGTVTISIVGRTTYAFGVALGSGAIYALQRAAHALAAVIAQCCARSSSPLAGGFLAIVAVAGRRPPIPNSASAQPLVAARRRVAPIAVDRRAVPIGRREPYEPWALIWDLCLCRVVAAALWQHTAARWGAACFALGRARLVRRPDPASAATSAGSASTSRARCSRARLLPRRRLVLAALAHSAADLAVVPRGRRHRVRAHRPVDAQLRTTSRC